MIFTSGCEWLIAFIISVKSWFMILKISLSLIIILLFSVSMMEVEFKICQSKKKLYSSNVFFLDTFLKFKLLKYSLFVFNRITQKFICFLYLLQLISNIALVNLFSKPGSYHNCFPNRRS